MSTSKLLSVIDTDSRLLASVERVPELARAFELARTAAHDFVRVARPTYADLMGMNPFDRAVFISEML